MNRKIRIAIRLITGLVGYLFLGSICSAATWQLPPANAPTAQSTALPNDSKILTVLNRVVEKNDTVPGIVAAIVHAENPIRIAAAGVRKAGSPQMLTVEDLMHLGSCTKAMTATAIGRLMDQNKITLDSTIRDLLPELSEQIHDDYAKVTLHQLLQHRAGMPANAKSWWLQTGSDLAERRQLIAVASLQEKPSHQEGTKYLYSNLGYMVAGLMAARAAEVTWEELMKREVFEPLKMESAGFGIPGRTGEVVQPWGHRIINGQLTPVQFDNAPALGPAGTVFLNLADWGKFAVVHANEKDGGYLSSQTLRAMHDARPEGDYALGWVVSNRPWAGGKTISHSGSNTMWFCSVWIAPRKQVAYLVAANVAGERVPQILDSVIGELIKIDQQ